MADEEKRSENMQTLMTPSDRKRIEELAEGQERSVSDMMRLLVLDSLKRWEPSNSLRRKVKQ